MTDYYPLIARAVEELDRSTGEARQALYERARKAVAQLRSNPALLEADIAKECLALEEAIHKVEAETAGRSRTEARTEPQSAAPTEGTPDDSAQVASKSPRRRRAEPPPAGLPTAREQLLSGRSSRKRKAMKGGSRDVVRDVPDLGATTAKATQTARQARQPYEPEAPQYPPAKEYLDTHDLKRKAVKGFRDVVRDVPDLGATTAKATQTGRQVRQSYEPEARQYPPAKEYLDAHDYSGDYATRQERDLEPAYEPDDEQPVVAPPARHALRNAAPEEEYERKGRGPTILPVVLIIFAGVVAAIYWQRSAITEFYRYIGSKPQSPAGQETSSVRPKFSGRVRLEQDRGQAPGPAAVGDQTAPAVAQRVVLYEEDPSDPHGKRYVGSAIWRTETNSAGSGIAPEVAVRADAEIPERGMTVTWSLRRNTDKALPASYTIETMFKLSADFPSGIADVPGILMKQAEQARGTELAGRAIKVTEGFFLIGLSAVDTDVRRNEQLLKDRPWFDIPIVYTNGGRALLAMEKGPPGVRAFAEAFAVWEKEIAPGTE
jgi:hypothetical protein